MRKLVDFFARRRAWQVFLMLVLPILASQIYVSSQLPTPTSEMQTPSLDGLEAQFRSTLLVSLVMAVLFLGWLLSVGLAANRRIICELRPGARFPLASAAYALGYIALAQFIWPGPEELSSGDASMGLIVPLHILAVIAMFYVLAFSAKNLILAERQQPVSFFDYSGPFFLMWFFPIGVWFVQPRINELIEA